MRVRKVKRKVWGVCLEEVKGSGDVGSSIGGLDLGDGRGGKRLDLGDYRL
jgi:hypothetical protein